MKIIYDKQQDALYIDLAKGAYRSSKKISESILIDVAKDGKILGIEILDATQNIKYFDPKDISLQVSSTA